MEVLNLLSGGQAKFREWTDRMLNALTRVNNSSRRAVKVLNSAMDGAVPDPNEEGDKMRLLSWRMTAAEATRDRQGEEGAAPPK